MFVLSIDPGTSSLGMSIFTYNVVDGLLVFQHEHTTTFNVDVIAIEKYQDTIIERYGFKQGRILTCKDIMVSMLKTWNPDVVVCESPYMGRFPQAFAALVECMQALKLGVIEYNNTLPFVTYDPATIKQAVGVKGTSGDKTQMTAAVNRLYPDIKTNQLDEHGIDSICVGYTWFKQQQKRLSIE